MMLRLRYYLRLGWVRVFPQGNEIYNAKLLADLGECKIRMLFPVQNENGKEKGAIHSECM